MTARALSNWYVVETDIGEQAHKDFHHLSNVSKIRLV